MDTHFKDRFNRKFIICPKFLGYDQVGSSVAFNRDTLPSSIWLEGDILWRDTKLKRHCTTGPSTIKINGEIAFAINNIYITKLEWLLAIENEN